jgi:hypothetical protein
MTRLIAATLAAILLTACAADPPTAPTPTPTVAQSPTTVADVPPGAFGSPTPTGPITLTPWIQQVAWPQFITDGLGLVREVDDLTGVSLWASSLNQDGSVAVGCVYTWDYGDGAQSPMLLSYSTGHVYPSFGSWQVAVTARCQSRTATATLALQLPVACRTTPALNCR